MWESQKLNSCSIHKPMNNFKGQMALDCNHIFFSRNKVPIFFIGNIWQVIKGINILNTKINQLILNSNHAILRFTQVALKFLLLYLCNLVQQLNQNTLNS
ncbi:hypothetical protein ACH5RR_023139 [Cinchona calisaya]|uniref:Uncharacterized protein n=1 Tax=Cinchona calisaya TaxID=153742 RepID=A0ABD2Z9T8_9GENT